MREQIKVDSTGEILTVDEGQHGGVVLMSGDKVVLELKKGEADSLGTALLSVGATADRRSLIAKAAGLE